jgi:hypothetical protein
VVAIALLALAGLYAGDYLSEHYRIPGNRQVFDTVQVQTLYAVRQKDNRIEYSLGDTVFETCVRSLFPHLGYTPCWYLSRHATRHIDAGLAAPGGPNPEHGCSENSGRFVESKRVNYCQTEHKCSESLPPGQIRAGFAWRETAPFPDIHVRENGDALLKTNQLLVAGRTDLSGSRFLRAEFAFANPPQATLYDAIGRRPGGEKTGEACK